MDVRGELGALERQASLGAGAAASASPAAPARGGKGKRGRKRTRDGEDLLIGAAVKEDLEHEVWSLRHAPRTASALAVNPKKVEEVRAWMENAALSGNKRRQSWVRTEES